MNQVRHDGEVRENRGNPDVVSHLGPFSQLFLSVQSLFLSVSCYFYHQGMAATTEDTTAENGHGGAQSPMFLLEAHLALS